MARKSSSIVQEESYPFPAEPPRDEVDDARLMDLDVNEESPFLRAQKRVSARRSTIPKKTANRLFWAAGVVAILCVAALGLAALYQYGERSWRFRIDSSDDIEVAGMQNVTKAQIMEVMGADIGRNIFFIPLGQQKAQLEQIPWVESASVMRFVPNRLQVEIHERTPIAFARVGPRIFLIDAGGILMDLPPKHKYSFPVILGMNPGEPISTRLPRMKAYNDLVQALDSSGARYSQDLSEVDLTDLDNLKVRVNDPAGDVLVELGSTNYLNRYQIYVGHVRDWRRQFQKLESVNLRYDNQVIVNPDMEGKPRQATISPSVAKAAIAAGVKPASLNTRIGPHEKPIPKPVFEMSDKKLDPKPAAKKPLVKAKAKKAPPKPTKTVAKKDAGKHPVPPAKASATAQPAAKKPSTSVAGNTTPKPSPGIAKQQGAGVN